MLAYPSLVGRPEHDEAVWWDLVGVGEQKRDRLDVGADRGHLEVEAVRDLLGIEPEADQVGHAALWLGEWADWAARHGGPNSRRPISTSTVRPSAICNARTFTSA